MRFLRWHCPPWVRHRIWNTSPGGLRPSTLPLGHGCSPQYWLFNTWMGKKHFCFFQTAGTGNRAPNSGVKGSGANHYPRAPALFHWTSYVHSPWPMTCLCLWFAGVVHTVIGEKREQNSTNTWYNVTWFDIYYFYSGSFDHREVFSILPTQIAYFHYDLKLYGLRSW